MVLAPTPSQFTRQQAHQRMLGVGLLVLVCGCPVLATQVASALKQPAVRVLVKPRLPLQFTTPTLVATGFGKIPAAFTTVPLVARGFGSLPSTLTTPTLVAKGYGQVPATLTTPALVARGFGNLPAQFTTKPLIVALPGSRQSGKPR